MQQGIVGDPSSMMFPQACYAVVSGRAIETVVENRAAYDEFYKRNLAGKHISVLNVQRLPQLST